MIHLLTRKNLQSKPLIYMFTISSLVLFACSSFRHILFKSNAFDLGIFDQSIYLISRFQTPFTTLMGIHILGDHATLIHYLLAVPYLIFPSVYWLFFVQSLALSSGIFAVRQLSLDSGLKEKQANAMMLVYLLYPVIFNANLFDFHPEVIAVPLILFAVLYANRHEKVKFCICILLVLGCKAVLSLTVIALGIYLSISEKKRFYGLFSLFLGLFWFIFSVQFLIPHFSDGVAAVNRYSDLGDSVFEIAINALVQPQILLGKVFTAANFEYVIYLFLPIFWGVSRYSFLPLIGAIPCIGINILSDSLSQKNLVLHYSLPAIPFLILAVIATVASNQGFLRGRRNIVIWSAISFLIFAKFTYFTSLYLEYTDNWKATNNAISLVDDTGGVYTNSQIVPHLTHRSLINFTNNAQADHDLRDYKYVLLNMRHPGWASDAILMENTLAKVNRLTNFGLIYEQDDVFLFKQRN